MKDPAGPFRTKVRVKDARLESGRPVGSAEPQAAPQRPGSLMEALKKARHPQSGAHPQNAEGAGAVVPSSDSRQDGQGAESEPQHPKPPRPARAKVGRLAAARLRQLQRAREAAAGLESLARGEIEEAIVEIVRRDDKRGKHRRPVHPAHKR